MTSREYWNEDPYLAQAYRKAHQLRIEMRNQELWLAGLYNHNAFTVAINNAFSKKQLKYIQKPIELTEPSEAEKQRRIAETRKKLVARLNAFKDEFEKRKRAEAK